MEWKCVHGTIPSVNHNIILIIFPRTLKSDEWIARSNRLRQILDAKIEYVYNTTSNDSIKSALRPCRERVIEKEINVACGNYLFALEPFFLH